MQHPINEVCVQRILTSGEDGQKGKLPWDIFRCSISLLGLESLTQHIDQTTFMREGVGELNDETSASFSLFDETLTQDAL